MPKYNIKNIIIFLIFVIFTPISAYFTLKIGLDTEYRMVSSFFMLVLALKSPKKDTGP